MLILKSSFKATLGVVEGYTDEVEGLLQNATYGLAALETLVDEIETYLKHATYGLDALHTDIAAIPVTAMRGTDSAAVASAEQRSRYWLSFFGANTAVLVIPAAAVDKDWGDVVINDIPTGATVEWVDCILVIGGTFDTSAAENQVTAASKTLRVKASGGSWGTDDIVALTFDQNSLQTKADSYGGGKVIGGKTDISSVITGNGTYNFRSEETNRTDAVDVTGASLELHDTYIIVRIMYST